MAVKMYVLAFAVDEILEVGGASEASPFGCAISSGECVLIVNMLYLPQRSCWRPSLI